MIKNILCAAAALMLFSCTQTSNSTKGIVLSTTPLFKEDSDVVIQVVPVGTEIEYLGEKGPLLKVRVNGTEGYLDPHRVTLNTKGALVKQGYQPRKTPSSEEVSIGNVPEGSFVTFDSVSGDMTRVYLEKSDYSGWMPTNFLSEDPADVAVAAALDRLDDLQDAEKYKALIETAAKYPTHPMLLTIKVDLREVVTEEDFRILDYYGVAVDKENGQIVTSTAIAKQNIWGYLQTILPWPKGDDPFGYEGQENGQYTFTDSRWAYFNYLSALPAFVKLDAKPQAIEIDYAIREVPSDAFYLYRMDRSPEQITLLYNRFKPLLTEIIQSGNIRDFRGDMKSLIRVYDHIAKIPNHAKVVKDISASVAKWDKEHTSANGFLDTYVAVIDQMDLYQPILIEEMVTPETMGRDIWYHSFWVRRFNEGNQKVVYDILKELVQVVPGEEVNDEYDPEGEEGGYAGYGEATIQTGTFTCVYNGYSFGDCGHYLFSCGDFGDADTGSLSESDNALWDSLTDDDGNSNPDYVGKEFIMTVEETTGPACNEGQGGEGTIPKLTEFRLKE